MKNLKEMSYKMIKENKILVTIVIILLITCIIFPQDNKTTFTKTNLYSTSDTDENELKLKKILETIEGVDCVEVMITYKNESYKTSKEPCGIIITTTKADDINAVTNIKAAVEAVYEIPPHKIQIFKQKIRKE